MICVPSQTIYEKAAKMPLAYLSDCKAVAQIRAADQFWCFALEDFYKIRRKYGGYAVSEADPFVQDQPISGCCDRADQY